jgi:hypothetical protein
MSPFLTDILQCASRFDYSALDMNEPLLFIQKYKFL